VGQLLKLFEVAREWEFPLAFTFNINLMVCDKIKLFNPLTVHGWQKKGKLFGAL